MATQSDYLTVDELADLLRSSPSAVYTARHRNIEPYSLGVKVGARLFWRRADLDAWFDRQQEAQKRDRRS